MSNAVIHLGSSDPKTHRGKLGVVKLIADFISFRKLSQKEAAELFQIDSVALEKILMGKVADYSVDELMRFYLILVK